MNLITNEQIGRMKEAFAAGYSIRATARLTGLDRKTVSRYFPRGDGLLCVCGQPIEHEGWCRSRYEQNQPQRADDARQEFMKFWLGGKSPAIIHLKQPKWIAPPAFQAKGDDLLLLVNGLVPRWLPPQLRGDVCQEIIVAVLGGELKQTDIPAQMKRFISGQRKAQESDYMAISLDAPRQDGRSWHEVLSSTTNP